MYASTSSIVKERNAHNLLKELESEIKEIKTTEEYTNYLNFCAQFHNYSWNNQGLIQMQCKNATHVMGYNGWKKLGRHVLKGEKAIKILAPRPYTTTKEDDDGVPIKKEGIYFTPVNVFDISQTDGEPLPEYSFETNGDGDFLPNLLSYCDELSINVKFTEGLYAYGLSRKGLVEIRDESNVSTQVSTLIHEIVHELLHQNSSKPGKQQVEFEAESTCYIVCKHFGLSQKSAKYLALYGEYSLTKSMDTISKTAKNMIERLTEIGEESPHLSHNPMW
jgi:hypothetical protein